MFYFPQRKKADTSKYWPRNKGIRDSDKTDVVSQPRVQTNRFHKVRMTI